MLAKNKGAESTLSRVVARPASKQVRQSFDEYYSADESNHVERIASPGFQDLLSLLKGGYLGKDYVNGRGRAALDVGCGNGFNLVTLGLLGWQPHGCEITPVIAERAAANAARFRVRANVTVGGNPVLPFLDERFHLLLSINTIHYLGDPAAVMATIDEYHRVLDKGGALVALLIHPGNFLLKGADDMGNGVWRIRRTDDFRTGMDLFVFRSMAEVRKAFKRRFVKVQIGVNNTFIDKRNRRCYVVTAFTDT